MKYVALLRGINVGGNNPIKMFALKEAFEKVELKNVLTYINSGNVVFETTETNDEMLMTELESMLTRTFKYKARLILKSYKQVKQIVADAPSLWKTNNDLRCYVAFLKDSITAADAVKEIEVKEGVDSLKAGPGVLYMTTVMKERTKSAFNKLVGKKIYQDMTIRNYNTTQKVLILMEKIKI